MRADGLRLDWKRARVVAAGFGMALWRRRLRHCLDLEQAIELDFLDPGDEMLEGTDPVRQQLQIVEELLDDASGDVVRSARSRRHGEFDRPLRLPRLS